MKTRADMSLNLIIAAIVAVFLLVLIIAIVSGVLGDAWATITGISSDDVDSAQSICTTKCNDLKTRVGVSGTAVWKTSSYCTQVYRIDLNSDGDISENERLHCWDNPINVECSYLSTDAEGNNIDLTFADCGIFESSEEEAMA